MRDDVLKYDRIRNLRIDKDLTQQKVAEILNIAANTLSQYETGTRNIPNDVLVKIADLYDTSVDYLLGRTDIPIPYENTKARK